MSRLQPPRACVAHEGKRAIAPKFDAGGRALVRLRPGDPISLVAAEIQSWTEASDRQWSWLHCNIQVACHSDPLRDRIVISIGYGMMADDRVQPATMSLGQQA